MFLTFAGLWIPFFYLRTFAISALAMSPSDSFAVLMVLNATGIPGRIIPALLSDCGPDTLDTYILVLLNTSLALLCWPLVTTKAAMFVWASAYGFFSGGAVSLVQAGVVSLSGNESKLGRNIGIVFGFAGTASLLGAPVGGELIEAGKKVFGHDGESFLLLQLCTGAFMLLGCAVLVVARAMRTGRQVVVRA